MPPPAAAPPAQPLEDAPAPQAQAPAPEVIHEPPTLPQPAQPAATPVADLAAPAGDVGAPPMPPEPEIPESEPFEAVLLIGADDGTEYAPLPLPTTPEEAAAEEEADAGPMVDGILCERGHFNHPLALYCSTCGVSTVHRTRTTVKGPRPTLGVIVIDDGTTYTLDADYVVGREPDQAPAVQSDAARPLRLFDTERSTSRVHAEIRLQEWDVLVVDRGSANGTYVLPREAGQWQRLAAETPQKIEPGTRVAFGRRVMTYDTHHQV
jgi:hypothetical protein